MVKTSIPDRIMKILMQLELHRNLWAVTGNGHTRIWEEGPALDSSQPSPPLIFASLLPAFLSSPISGPSPLRIPGLCSSSSSSPHS